MRPFVCPHPIIYDDARLCPDLVQLESCVSRTVICVPYSVTCVVISEKRVSASGSVIKLGRICMCLHPLNYSFVPLNYLANGVLAMVVVLRVLGVRHGASW